jgi:glycosyltransferase involved in cell wall biosynthesis
MISSERDIQLEPIVGMSLTDYTFSQPGLVSVIMPAHNAERFIAQSIQSVLSQSYPNHETIVVDDGSTDTTLEVLKAFGDKIMVLSQPNGGPSAARNTGLKAAKGEFIWFLDSDDLLHPDALALTTSHLRANSGSGVAVGMWSVINSRGKTLTDCSGAWKAGAAGSEVLFRHMLIKTLFPPSVALLRRSWLDDVRGWDPTLWCAEDRDLWLRLLDAGCQFDFLPIEVAQYRQHEANATLNLTRVEEHLRRYLEKWFGGEEALDSLRTKVKPYAWAEALLSTATVCAKQDPIQVQRLIDEACWQLSLAESDDELVSKILWDSYRKPWEGDVQRVLWPKAPASVANLCWIHLRESVRSNQYWSALAWLFSICARDPGFLIGKLRTLSRRSSTSQ